MEKSQRAFEFASTDWPSPGEGDFIAELPAGIRGTGQLFEALGRVLVFPSYFGENWNALSDLLRDLHWMPMREVVLVHRDLPRLDPLDLRNYLEVLEEAVQSWKPEEEHHLRVVFPESARSEITRALATPLAP
jgi:hypothetical protein